MFTKVSRNILKSHRNFLGIFMEDFGQAGVKIAKTNGAYSKKDSRNEGKETRPKHMLDPGSSNNLRGVGLIQLLQNPKSNGQEHVVHHKPKREHTDTESTPYIQ
jgi:hypothetical protein